MYRDDEFEERYRAARSPQDDALIAEYCGDIETRLRAAENRRAARRIVAQTCQDFGQQCGSEIIARFLQRHVESVYESIWGTEP